MTVTIKDTYQATYYYMQGGKIVSVTSRLLPYEKAQKFGFRAQWSMTMESVPEWAIQKWNDQAALVEVGHFEAARKRLKRIIHGML